MRAFLLAMLAAAAGLLASCQASTLLVGIQDEVNTFQGLHTPTIQPGTTVWRNAATALSVTLSNPGTGTTMFYTTDGSAPLFNQQGITQGNATMAISTFPFTFPTSAWGTGIHSVRAVSWYPNQRSDEGRVDYGVAGDGGAVWAQAGFGSAGGAITSVAVSSGGLLYSGGYYVNSSGKTVGLILQTDTSGRVVSRWEITPASSGSAKVTGMTTDSTGNIIVVGNLEPSDTYVFTDGTSMSTSGAYHTMGFIAQLTAAGTCSWARVSTSSNSSVSVSYNGVAIKGTSTIYLVATVTGAGPVAFASSSVPLTVSAFPSSVTNGILIDYTGGVPSSSFMAQTNSGSDRFWAAAVDSSNNIWIGGDVSASSITYPPSGIITGGSLAYPRALVLKLSSITTASAAYYPTGGTVSSVLAISVNGTNVVVGGYQADTPARVWNIGSISISGTSPGLNGFVALLTGATPWGASLNGLGNSQVNGVVVDSAGSPWIVGSFGGGSYTLAGGGPFVANSSRSPFASRLSSAGTFTWFTTVAAGSPSGEYRAVAHDNNTIGQLIVGGVLSGTSTADWGDTVKAHGSASGDSPLLLQLFD